MPENEYTPGVELEVAPDSGDALPAISAIVNVPDTYESVRRTMECMKSQTAAGKMEIVIVTPSYRQLELDESEMTCFHSWQVVEFQEDKSHSAGYVAGIRQARAPIIALTEDHSFPDENWAELLIAAHREPCAAVGPSMCNGNPEKFLSRVDYYHAYSEWTHPVTSGPVRHLPGHNCSYKRDILLGLDSKLEVLMEAESVLHRHLTAQGYRLLLESKTCTAHNNFTSWSAWILLRYHIGRQFAAAWASEWSWPRRLLFLAASPLIPWVRLWRIQRRIRRGQRCITLAGLLPVLFLGLLLEWLGQARGFVAGSGGSREKVFEYELRRFGREQS
jgi:hypothetical protein